VSSPKYVNGKEMGVRATPPTAAKMNRIARKVWSCEGLTPALSAAEAAQQAERDMVAQSWAIVTENLSNKAKADKKDALQKHHSAIQSHAARALRPKKKPTHRNEVITAMRPAKKRGDSLAQFLQSAEAESIDDIKITWVEKFGKYALDTLATGDGHKVSRRTILDWWAAAK
jgi:hypothetical protein